MGIPYRQNINLYPLIMILRDPISYRAKIINLEIKPLIFKVKGRIIGILFNILLLRNNKAVLKMPQFREYKLKINWIIG